MPRKAAIDRALGPDTDLLAVCMEAQQIDAEAALLMDQLESLLAGLPTQHPATLAILGQLRSLLDSYLRAVEQATALSAQTLPGLAAKASLLLLHLRSGENSERLAASLARDADEQLAMGNAWPAAVSGGRKGSNQSAAQHLAKDRPHLAQGLPGPHRLSKPPT